MRPRAEIPSCVDSVYHNTFSSEIQSAISFSPNPHGLYHFTPSYHLELDTTCLWVQALRQ
jgi:hypothetical protein